MTELSPRLPAFKAYDIRGRVPAELDADMAYGLGLAYAELFSPKVVALGRDARAESFMLQNALAQGLVARGVEVRDIGLCGTEEVYFAAQQAGIDGGIMVTASHNPMGYNGMKLVRAGAVPISGDTGLKDLEARVRAGRGTEIAPGSHAPMTPWNLRPAYVRFLLGAIDVATLDPLKIVVNAGNGTAGLVIDALADGLPFEFVRVQHIPDETFPLGVPNPLLPKNRAATAEAVRASAADFGVAWDGDFDRCFLFDEHGRFIEGYYIVGLLAETLLARHAGEKIIHDPRLTWNTIDQVQAAGGTPVLSRTGHAFIKERMRAENALYGGEMSAHHYFREFAYCDNGMLPWLLVAQLMSVTDKKLSELVGLRQAAFPASGEINRRVNDLPGAIARVEAAFASAGSGALVDHTDGLSAEYADWRFNLRGSNTEPVLRLNVESRGQPTLMLEKTDAILALIGGIDPDATAHEGH